MVFIWMKLTQYLNQFRKGWNNKKRIVSVLLLVFLLLSLLPVMCMAETESGERTVAWFDDGSYMTETVTESPMRASGSKTGTKTRTYYSSRGTALWKVTLTGSFTFTGTSATCTSSSCSATMYDSSWYVISKSSEKSGNTANASATIGEKVLGVTVSRVPVSLTLSCDVNGNLT